MLISQFLGLSSAFIRCAVVLWYGTKAPVLIEIERLGMKAKIHTKWLGTYPFG